MESSLISKAAYGIYGHSDKDSLSLIRNFYNEIEEEYIVDKINISDMPNAKYSGNIKKGDIISIVPDYLIQEDKGQFLLLKELENFNSEISLLGKKAVMKKTKNDEFRIYVEGVSHGISSIYILENGVNISYNSNKTYMKNSDAELALLLDGIGIIKIY